MQELARLPPCAGTVVVRLHVSGASGAVQALEWLTDTLVPLPAAEYSAADARDDVFEAVKRRLGGAQFPTCAEGARPTLPENLTCSSTRCAALGAAGKRFARVLLLCVLSKSGSALDGRTQREPATLSGQQARALLVGCIKVRTSSALVCTAARNIPDAFLNYGAQGTRK